MKPWRAIVWGLAALGTAAAQSSGPLDLTNFVVLGEGLAAGFANFSLHRVHQENSFPAVMARQMGAQNFPQPLFQAPGLGNVPGFAALPPRVPGTLEDTVRAPGGPKPTDRSNAQPPFSLFVFNVSIPGMKLADALSRRPVRPLIQVNDSQQTLVNMTLAFPGMVAGPNKPLWTAAEYARQMNPSFGMVALGYAEMVEAAAKNDVVLLPDPSAFRADFAQAVALVRGPGVPVAVATVPDPLDTAFVSTVEAAANLLTADPAGLRRRFALRTDDRVTIPGLLAMGSQLLSGTSVPLRPGSVVDAATAGQIHRRVRDINDQITAVARDAGGAVCDLFALFRQARANGVVAGGRALTADFQGGLYSLSGFYPGATMQTLMANECLSAINKTFGTSYPAADVNAAAARDPALRLVPLRGGVRMAVPR